MAFAGFSEQTVDFLWGIRLNNDRGWYQEHKEECRTFLTGPMNALAGEILEHFDSLRPEAGFTVHVSRIFRDARRLYGKGPFKDHLWFSVFEARYGENAGRPSFWFQIGPDVWSYGMGFWDEHGAVMKKLRNIIRSDPAGLEDLDALLASQDEFRLGGAEYKRQYRDCPVPALSDWYCRKSIELIHEEPVGPAICTADLSRRLWEGMEQLLPFYDYFFPLSLQEETEDNDNDTEVP